MPRISRNSLAWSPHRHIYEWRDNPGDRVQYVSPESPTLLEWVGLVTSFSFQGRNGSYSVCKEYKQRGEGYWYAHVRVNGKRAKRYLGRDIDLTLTRLECVAHELWQNVPVKQRIDNAFTTKNDTYFFSDTSNDLFLATKIHIPMLRSRLVHRPRLIHQLQKGVDHSLTLLSAPVGFGKSTLLSEWLTSCTNRIAWLTLEPQDNEPIRFFSYLLAALQMSTPRQVVSGQVVNPPIQSASMETVLMFLINDLQQKLAAQEHRILVLDNYQVITKESIHQGLSYLLEHLPPWMHLVLATREDPPLHLARLRGRDDLLELRASDLRFMQEEASTFLLEVMDLPLSYAECVTLQARTEGWITGLQLAALSIRGREDSKAFITAFSGSNHYVMDYLVQEVLKQQSVVIQDFLLRTCILDRLCAPLCDAVTEGRGSQAILDYLDRANLFLVALDENGQWYRYHRLFAEALRQQLKQTDHILVSELLNRANCWYKQQGSNIEIAPLVRSTPVLPSELLTSREHEVLLLLRDGASNREIADHLVLSMNTVKKHVLNICRKFNVRSRAQVIAKLRTPQLS